MWVVLFSPSSLPDLWCVALLMLAIGACVKWFFRCVCGWHCSDIAMSRSFFWLLSFYKAWVKCTNWHWLLEGQPCFESCCDWLPQDSSAFHKDLFIYLGFRGSSAGKESACNAEDPGLNPGSGRSAGEGIGYLCQYSWASLVAQLGKESAFNVRELVSIPGSGRSPGEENSYPLQYSGLENSMDRGRVFCFY